MTLAGIGSQLLQLFLALALAPLLVGWVNQCRAWLQNKSAPPLLLPYFTIRKLFVKDAVVADNGVVINYVTNNPDAKFKTVSDKAFEPEQYGFAVKKGNTELLDKLSAELEAA